MDRAQSDKWRTRSEDDGAEGFDTGQDIHWRALSALAVFRLLMAVLLMATFASSDSPRFFGDLYPQLFLIALLIWFAFGVGGAYACARRAPAVRLLTEFLLFFDILVIATLSLASGGNSSGIAGLLIIFVGAGGFILSSLMSLFFAALATVAILGVQVALNLFGNASLLDYPAAGVLSAILFVAVLAIRPVARRLAQSEALARQQRVDIANLADLNRYVLQHLREAIIVIDAEDRIRLMNDAAAAYLGIARTKTDGQLADYAENLAAHVDLWRAQRGAAQPAAEATLPGFDGGMLQVNIAPFGDSDRLAASLILFLEDSSVLAERVQQSKLASLGRLSASIAHEIRNPVGAMSHAAQLLAEQTNDETQQRLVSIIERNSGRVSQIIEDIMQLSRRDTGRPRRLVLAKWLDDFCREYLETHRLPPGAIEMIGEEAITEIIFDPGHLRQVLTNLLDNAGRHAAMSEQQPVGLNWGRISGSRRPFLEVRDHGPGIDPALEQQIFEPFFTQHEDGAGLGLYLCQELCELNRATLSYRPNPDGGAILHIVFADPSRWSGVS